MKADTDGLTLGYLYQSPPPLVSFRSSFLFLFLFFTCLFEYILTPLRSTSCRCANELPYSLESAKLLIDLKIRRYVLREREREMFNFYSSHLFIIYIFKKIVEHL